MLRFVGFTTRVFLRGNRRFFVKSTRQVRLFAFAAASASAIFLLCFSNAIPSARAQLFRQGVATSRSNPQAQAPKSNAATRSATTGTGRSGGIFPTPQPGARPISRPNPQNNARPTTAASPDALTQASGDRNEAQEVLARVPWNALSASAREKLRALATNPTIYRRLPMAGGYCNPELFDFLLVNPHVVVALWRDMGYDDLAMAPTGPNRYSIREKTGTVGIVQILYQDSETTIVYCSGNYRGPVVSRTLEGEMFLVLQTRYTEDPEGRPIVVCRMDAFADLKNAGADLLGRAFGAALGKIGDANFEQTLAFIDSVSQTAEKQPAELIERIARLRELSPETRRLFAAKTTEVARQAQLRARGELVQYRLAPKLNSPSPQYARILSRESNNRVATSPTIAPNANAGSVAPYGRLPVPSAIRPQPSFDGDRPSLEQNSFALSQNGDDFEATLDWDADPPTSEVFATQRLNDEASNGLTNPLIAAPRVPTTSTANANRRESARFADALELLQDSQNSSEAQEEPVLALDAAAPLRTQDDATIETEAPLLQDFEDALGEAEDGANDETNVPTLAIPEFETPSDESLFSIEGKPAPLETLDKTSAARSDANRATDDAKTDADAAPLLFLPDFADEPNFADDPDFADETESTSASKTTDVAAQESATRQAAPVRALPPTTPIRLNAPKNSTSATPTWRAVDPKRGDAKQASAPSERVEKTARSDSTQTLSSQGVTFRKPEIK